MGFLAFGRTAVAIAITLIPGRAVLTAGLAAIITVAPLKEAECPVKLYCFYASFKVILQHFFTTFLLLVFMVKYTKCIVSVYKKIQ